MRLLQRGYQMDGNAYLFLGSCPSDWVKSASAAYHAGISRTLVFLRGLADPQCHCRISRTLQPGRPAHDQYLPTPCILALSRCKSQDAKEHVRGCEGGQAISFEEGSFVNVEVEFTHSKVIDFDHSHNPPLTFSIRRAHDADRSHPKCT